MTTKTGPRELYILTDGVEIHAIGAFLSEEAEEENRKADEATAGNMQWTPCAEHYMVSDECRRALVFPRDSVAKQEGAAR